MNIVVVGLSHKTASVEIREKVAFAPNQMEKPLRELVSLPDISRRGDRFHLQPGGDLRHHP